RKYRQGLRQRLTGYTAAERARFATGQWIWVHAVSVGELQAARPLLRQIKQQYPQHSLLVTTVTLTGQTLAKTVAEIDACLYLPLDLYPLCRRMLAMVKPEILLIMETELWPNLIRTAAASSIPLFLINARLSDTSFGRYLRARFLFRPLLQCLTAILAQSEKDADRFLQLGAEPSRIFSAGNIKFEVAPQTLDPITRVTWRERFAIRESDLVLLGGSTFPGEEWILFRIVAALRNEGIPVRLILAPRHIERADSLVSEFKKLGVAVLRRSALPDSSAIAEEAVLLLDTIGELRSVYAAADLVFIGKSLCDKGGQNPIEPAAWGKPILFGEHMQNFRDIAALFLEAQAAVCVENEMELLERCRAFCQSEALRAQYGENARRVIERNRGALERIMQVLREQY
ncbi:MAG: 3-deoxy-D-manno-octulosonic acid transferase, partial [bacterium]|nr:3-deoxy-D-manno-octulosonic acid transferase [bacterium]